MRTTSLGITLLLGIWFAFSAFSSLNNAFSFNIHAIRGIAIMDGQRVQVGDRIKNPELLRFFPESIVCLVSKDQTYYYFQPSGGCISGPCIGAATVVVNNRGKLQKGTMAELAIIQGLLHKESNAIAFTKQPAP